MSRTFTCALLLGASTLVIAMYGMFASGMFPPIVRPRSMRGVTGTALITIGTALVIALAAIAVTTTAGILHWPYAIIVGGLGLLLGPLVFQRLPQALTDNPAGAMLLCAVIVALAGAWTVIAP